ncbi:MAG: Rap1a/Tai family immunity protein [Solimonas sp.]
MKILLAIVALGLPAAAPAMSGAEYLQHCQQRTTYDQALCLGYLDALLEGRTRGAEVASLVPVAMPASDPYCLPDGATIQQIRTTVVAGLLRVSAAQRQIEARALITDLLRRAYPLQACPR